MPVLRCASVAHGYEGSVALMITAVHTLVYADDAGAARAFFRDVLGWPYVDAHDGWLIFRTGPSELGVHPTATAGFSTAPHHEISLMCDDIERTVAELREKGVTFTREIRDEGFGRTVTFAVPGAGEMLLYQARHLLAHDL
jgi:catechol 2,3-dioxygenase-like lactoylglutathione lyase family enzyme